MNALVVIARLPSAALLSIQLLGVLLFVAIPLPGTGAWTGALVAAVLQLRMKKAFFAILLGVLISGVIVLLITNGVEFLIT